MRYQLILLLVTFDLVELLSQIDLSFLGEHFRGVLFLKCLQDPENFVLAHQTFLLRLQLKGVFREGAGVVFGRFEMLAIEVHPKRILSGVHLRERLLLILDSRAHIRHCWIFQLVCF